MKRVSEYRQYAADCRKLAGQMPRGEHRDQLQKMAATWDALAEERLAEERRAAGAAGPAVVAPDPA